MTTSEPILVHTCCAPCLCALLDALRAGGAAPTAFFFNPNIHPLIEYRRRLKAAQVLAERERIPLVAAGGYGLQAFLAATAGQWGRPERCRACYALRLDTAARHAAANRFGRFTSTLLVSPQQDREAVVELGHAAARRYGVAFDDSDRRALHGLGIERARRIQLYRQQYCGCIFSEQERYENTAVELHPPAGHGPRPRKPAERDPEASQ